MTTQVPETNRDYEGIERPYDASLYRSDPNLYNGNVETMPVKSDGSMSDVWIKNFIKSENWQPKSVGFYINGLTGYAEFSNVFVSGNIQALSGTIGGFTIGATSLYATSGGNTTVMSSGATAFYSGPTGFPTFSVTQAGALTATSGNISGAFTVGGRLATTIGSAIDVSGDFINDVINPALNTASQQILAGFTFGVSGAIRIGTVNDGIAISPNGILGTSGGSPTFTLDTGGNAYFYGDIISASITSSTITGGTMSIGSGNNIFKATSSGIQLGHATFASAPFRVDMAGNLTATLATITGALTAGPGSVISGLYVGNLDASKITTGTFIIGGTDQPSEMTIVVTSEASARLRWKTAGGSNMGRIWVDNSGYMGLNALGGQMYFYCNSDQIAIFQSTGRTLFFKETGFRNNVYFSTGASTYIWGADNTTMSYVAVTSHNFKLGGSSTVIIGNNIEIVGSYGLYIGGNKIVGSRKASVSAPSGGLIVDTQARNAINSIISRLVSHGLIS